MIEIKYGCVYKRSSKPVMKGSRIEPIEKAREEYKQLLEEGWKKTSIYNHYLQAQTKSKNFNLALLFKLRLGQIFKLIAMTNSGNRTLTQDLVLPKKPQNFN